MATSWRSGRAPPAIRSRLLLLVASVLVPAFVAGGLTLLASYRDDRQKVEQHLAETAHVLSLVVDRQLGQAEAALWALAASHHLQTGDYAAFDAQVRRALRLPESWVVLEEPGRQLVNTYLPAGAPLPRTGGQEHWTGTSSERTRVGNLFTGLVSGQPAVSTDLVVAGENGTQYLLSIITLAQALNRILSEQALPPTWTGVILDRNGTVVARSRDAERFVGQPGTPEAVARVRQGRAKDVFASKTLEGVESIVALSRSPASGWSFLVAAPRAELTRTARLSALYLLAIGGVLTAMGGLLALLVARSIARPVEELAAAAAALGRGKAPEQAATPGFRETQAVRDSILQSAEALRKRAAERDRAEAELRGLNETLEERIAARTRDLAEANERLMAEMEERRQAEARLSRAQRLEAVGQLTGGLAHDFNNLLTAVLGNLEMLGLRLGDGADERVRRLMDNARSAAERGARLTAQLLAFSRRQRLEARPIDVSTSLEGIAGLLRSTLGGTIRIETRSPEDLWPAMADPTQLELLVLNLALNARDAMPIGGRLVIEAANVTRGDPEGPEDPPAGDYVMVVVSDTGAGMPSEVLARAFEPFFTTKEVGKGSGLGLSQVLGITKQLGGGVRILSKPGEGTSVQVYLRRSHDAVAPGPVEIATGGPPADVLRGRRILLVDDDADVRRAVGGMLHEAGCRVVEAISGLAAVEAAQEAGDLDLALIDYAMPGMTGAEAARRIRARSPGLPLVMMTGYADYVGLAREGGIDALLQKPFRAAELVAELSGVLQRAKEASGNVVALKSRR